MVDLFLSNPILVATAATGLGLVLVETMAAGKARRARLSSSSRRRHKAPGKLEGTG